MAYRDDREALRSEVDTLQQELERARADNERLSRLEQRLEAAREEVRTIEAELSRARVPERPRSSARELVTLIALAAGIALGVFIFAMKSAPRAPHVAPAPSPVGSVSEGPARPSEDPPAPVPSYIPDAPTPAPMVHATWTAKVTRAQGLPLAVGAACTIDANVVADSNGARPTDVEVKCGERTIYSEQGALNGTSMLESGAGQRAGATPGTWIYEMVFRDQGTRSPTRNQVQLDSTMKVGRVWSDNLPEIRVDLAIKPGSAPVSVAIIKD